MSTSEEYWINTILTMINDVMDILHMILIDFDSINFAATKSKSTFIDTSQRKQIRNWRSLFQKRRISSEWRNFSFYLLSTHIISYFRLFMLWQLLFRFWVFVVLWLNWHFLFLTIFSVSTNFTYISFSCLSVNKMYS